MDITELRRLKPALDRFAHEFDDCVKTVPSRRHLLRYMMLRRELKPALRLRSVLPLPGNPLPVLPALPA